MEYQSFTYLKAMRTFLMWAQASFSAVFPSVSTAMMSMLGWQSNSWITWKMELKVYLARLVCYYLGMIQ